MSVKIRLRVVGKRKQHSYRIVAIESRNPRDGKYLEQLGWYNPRSKELQIDEEGIKKWQGKGAILTDAVKALLKRTDEDVSASKSAKSSKKASKRKSKKQSMKETAEESTKANTKESTGENTEARAEESAEASAEESTEESTDKKKSKKQSMKETTEESTKTSKKESADENTEESTDTGKTEEVNDVEGTDNLHSEVSGGST